MTPEAQRIAISESCGWVRVRSHWEKGDDSAYLNDSHCHRQLPDYLTDLNAMNAAEKILLAKHLPCYDVEITNVIGREIMSKGVSPLAGIYEWHATAAQRAEAFLRTIGKWDDSK